MMLRKISNGLAVLGLAALGYWVATLVRGEMYQAEAARHFSRPPAAGAVQAAPSKPRAIPKAGSPVALLEIPRLGVSTVVVEGAGDRELKLGPGHIPGTALPGRPGNVAVAGHRDTVFRPLRLVRIHDPIKLITSEGEFDYEVVSTTITRPDDVSVLRPTTRDSLTLVTCYPFYFVGSAPKRFIVHAELRSHARFSPADSRTSRLSKHASAAR
jgi:sortase A